MKTLLLTKRIIPKEMHNLKQRRENPRTPTFLVMGKQMRFNQTMEDCTRAYITVIGISILKSLRNLKDIGPLM